MIQALQQGSERGYLLSFCDEETRKMLALAGATVVIHTIRSGSEDLQSSIAVDVTDIARARLTEIIISDLNVNSVDVRVHIVTFDGESRAVVDTSFSFFHVNLLDGDKCTISSSDLTRQMGKKDINDLLKAYGVSND